MALNRENLAATLSNCFAQLGQLLRNQPPMPRTGADQADFLDAYQRCEAYSKELQDCISRIHGLFQLHDEPGEQLTLPARDLSNLGNAVWVYSNCRRELSIYFPMYSRLSEQLAQPAEA